MNLPNKGNQDRILNSWDGLQKAEAPPYFYTRLIGRMQNSLVTDTKRTFLLRPAFITTVLILALIINVISMWVFKNTNTQQATTKQINTPATIESFAKAYDLTNTAVYE